MKLWATINGKSVEIAEIKENKKRKQNNINTLKDCTEMFKIVKEGEKLPDNYISISELMELNTLRDYEVEK